MPKNPQPVLNYAPTPPLTQDQGFVTPVADGQTGAGNAGKRERRSGLVKAKLQFKGRDIWTGGESVVGRKGKDGKWTEVRGCSVM